MNLERDTFCSREHHVGGRDFGLVHQGGKDPVVLTTGSGRPEGRAAFAQLVATVTRVIEAGAPRAEEPAAAAARIWSAVHGLVLLEIAGFLGEGVERFLLPLVTKLAVGIGAAPEHAARCACLLAAERPKPERAAEI